MEARRQPEPATLAELVKLSNAADWEGCDVRQFSRASFEKLASLGKAEAYENDTNGEKARVDGMAQSELACEGARSSNGMRVTCEGARGSRRLTWSRRTGVYPTTKQRRRRLKPLLQPATLQLYSLGGVHCQQRCLPLLFLLRSVTEELAPEWSGVAETCCGRLSCWQWAPPKEYIL